VFIRGSLTASFRLSRTHKKAGAKIAPAEILKQKRAAQGSARIMRSLKYVMLFGS
jgi:hypothetical protein